MKSRDEVAGALSRAIEDLVCATEGLESAAHGSSAREMAQVAIVLAKGKIAAYQLVLGIGPASASRPQPVTGDQAEAAGRTAYAAIAQAGGDAGVGTPGLAWAIRSIRRRLGMNMTALAESIGVDQSQVSRYEAGLRSPGRPALCSLLQLAKGSERMPILEQMASVPAGVDTESLADLETRMEAAGDLFRRGRQLLRSNRKRSDGGTILQ